MPERELPKYKCHKEVRALKIAVISQLPSGDLVITPAEEGYEAFKVESRFVPIHAPGRPQVGWYFVLYEDGYKSFSPAEAFENGYTRTP
jgi:hypothetical protein